MPLDISNDRLVSWKNDLRLINNFLGEFVQCETSNIDNIPIHYPGDTFSVVGSRMVQNFYVEQNGEVSLKSKASPFDSYKVETAQNTDVTLAEVISFDDNHVIARVYFNDHPSKRKFKKSFVNMLKKQDLLYQGAIFNIVSKEDNEELTIKVEKCSQSISPEIEDLYAKIAESIDEGC